MGVSTNAILGFGYCWEEEMGKESSMRLFDEHWKEVGEIETRFNVRISTHCSGECPMLYIADAASFALVRRGYPEKVDVLALREAYMARVENGMQRNVVDALSALTALARSCEDEDLRRRGLLNYLEQKGNSTPDWFLCSDWG